MLPLVTSGQVLTNQYIIEKLSPLYKCSLTGVDNLWEDFFNALANELGDAFINDIAAGDWAKIVCMLRVLDLWDDDEFCGADLLWHGGFLEKFLNRRTNGRPRLVPRGFEKTTTVAIWAWRFVVRDRP